MKKVCSIILSICLVMGIMLPNAAFAAKGANNKLPLIIDFDAFEASDDGTKIPDLMYQTNAPQANLRGVYAASLCGSNAVSIRTAENSGWFGIQTYITKSVVPVTFEADISFKDYNVQRAISLGGSGISSSRVDAVMFYPEQDGRTDSKKLKVFGKLLDAEYKTDVVYRMSLTLNPSDKSYSFSLLGGEDDITSEGTIPASDKCYPLTDISCFALCSYGTNSGATTASDMITDNWAVYAKEITDKSYFYTSDDFEDFTGSEDGQTKPAGWNTYNTAAEKLNGLYSYEENENTYLSMKTNASYSWIQAGKKLNSAMSDVISVEFDINLKDLISHRAFKVGASDVKSGVEVIDFNKGKNAGVSLFGNAQNGVTLSADTWYHVRWQYSVKSETGNDRHHYYFSINGAGVDYENTYYIATNKNNSSITKLLAISSIGEVGFAQYDLGDSETLIDNFKITGRRLNIANDKALYNMSFDELTPGVGAALGNNGYINSGNSTSSYEIVDNSIQNRGNIFKIVSGSEWEYRLVKYYYDTTLAGSFEFGFDINLSDLNSERVMIFRNMGGSSTEYADAVCVLYDGSVTLFNKKVPGVKLDTNKWYNIVVRYNLYNGSAYISVNDGTNKSEYSDVIYTYFPGVFCETRIETRYSTASSATLYDNIYLKKIDYFSAAQDDVRRSLNVISSSPEVFSDDADGRTKSISVTLSNPLDENYVPEVVFNGKNISSDDIVVDETDILIKNIDVGAYTLNYVTFKNITDIYGNTLDVTMEFDAAEASEVPALSIGETIYTYKDGTQADASSLNSGTLVSKTDVTIANEHYDEFYYVVAIYNGDKLESVSWNKIDNYDITTELSTEVTVPEMSGCSAKTFIWNGNLMPIEP